MRDLLKSPGRLRSVFAVGSAIVLAAGLIGTAAGPALAIDDTATGFSYIESSETTATITGCVDTCPAALVIPETIAGLTVTEIGYRAFHLESTLETVTISNSVSVIDIEAFSASTRLSTVSLGAGVTTIAAGAFAGTALESLTIPAATAAIEASALTSIWRLATISVHPDNQSYRSIDGVLFDKAGTKLLRYPPSNSGNTYSFPDGVLTIGHSSFRGASRITSLTVPDSVTTIEDDAFISTTNLDILTIGSGVTTVGTNVVAHTAHDLTVRFLGNAPAMETGTWTGGGPTFYYRAEATGWPSEFDGHDFLSVRAPAITVPPLHETTTIGANITFTGHSWTLSAGSGNESWQWYKDGNPISGATDHYLQVLNVESDDAGEYTAEITTWAGSDVSEPATLAIGEPAEDPDSGLRYLAGGAIVPVIGCTDSCPSPLVIPAAIDGKPVDRIGGAAFYGRQDIDIVEFPASLRRIGDYAFAHAGPLTSFRFRGNFPAMRDNVFDASGSAPIYLRPGVTGWPEGPLNGHPIITASLPSIDIQPTGKSVTEGTAVTLTVVASAGIGGGEISYQWSRSEAPLGSATSPTLDFGNVTTLHAGTYAVTVTSWAGSVTSNTATLDVITPSVTPSPPSNPTPSGPIPAAKINQTIKVSLPRILKRQQVYKLPTKTAQDNTVRWKLNDAKACKIKSKSKLHCTKSTGKKKITLTAIASGTAHHNPFQQAFPRKVK